MTSYLTTSYPTRTSAGEPVARASTPSSALSTPAHGIPSHGGSREGGLPRGGSQPSAPDGRRATPRILVADDQGDVVEALRLLLKGAGYALQTARSPAGILSAVQAEDFDALLMDLNYTRDTTSGQEGLELLPQLQSLDLTLPVVVMTAWGSVNSAVEAMRRGAWDYIEKPWDNARLLAVLRTQVELGQALRKTQRLEGVTRLTRPDGLPTLIADAPAMQPLLRLMERVGPSDANVLITGEHGTGKELVARWLHAASPRAPQPFVAVNMGGLSEGVFESELFGHVKGAFTDAKTDRVGRFELAHGGTLFLDEIANVSLAGQAKLLRVLQTGELERVGSSKTRRVDVRILSATNVDLNDEVGAGRFREDLLFRLNTIEMHLPALRQRREDIPPLAMHFLRAHAQRYRKSLTALDTGAIQALLEHQWPGNIRELDHAVERAVLLAQGDVVRSTDLGLRAGTTAAGGVPRMEEMTLEEVERLLIQKALSRYEGNVSQAARALGLSRSALYRRLSSHGL
ncbi:MAG: sigma-54 dependent transcriptional regulator [Gemmatimonadaceae bacterium]